MNLFRRTHSAVIRLGLGALVLFFSPIILIGQQTLEWEVVNPFRFIHDQASIEELKRVYASLGEKSVENLERALQDMDEKEVDRLRAEDREACRRDGKPEEECKNLVNRAYLGWFARLAKDNYKKTCWDAVNLKFRSDENCSDYIKPAKHRVRVWLSGGLPSGLSAMTWLGGGERLNEEKNCDPTKYKLPCIEFDAEYIFKKPAGTLVTLHASDGTVIGRTEKPIRVKDNLVVGLGDSYASGEGNPDIPAKFLHRQADVDFAFFWKWRRMPRKDSDSGVAWLDTRCHRSMYSYQFKTALQYALSKSHEAVTFVSYSCSGGTTDTIIRQNQKPVEKMRTGNTIRPQLKVLRDVLQGREVDYLLLSTGGNDLNFAEYVTNILTSGRTRLMLKLFRQALSPSEEDAKKGIDQLRKNYKELQNALFNKMTGIAINGCDNHNPCPRIILTAYPNFFRNEKGELCKIDRDEFTIPFNEDVHRYDRAKHIKTTFAKKLWQFQTDTDIGVSNSVEETRWTVARAHREKYVTRGFCSQARPLTINENFMMMRRKNRIWFSRDWQNKDVKEYYDLRDYKAYGDRARWMRLPVDSKMTSDQQERFLNWFSYDFFFLDDRSNVMHPTAAALAAHADATYEKIEEVGAEHR